MVQSDANILTLSNTQAKELAGRFVTIGGLTYRFNNYDPGHPGLPPWRSGTEGKAYPLVDEDGFVAAYLKFFTHPTQKRLDRTAWLIGQQMHTWLPHLAAAPLVWTDSRHAVQNTKLDFEFAAYLAKAVPGETWLERKVSIVNGKTVFPETLRWRCAQDLILTLAVLERANLVHGDLSPNNLIVDFHDPPHDPTVYLIDFDAFAAMAAGESQSVAVAEGGTYGTDGYCPPHLAASASAGDGSVAPYSDRYGRDMLLLEFLLMRHGLPADDPLAHWNRGQLQREFAAWRARNDPNYGQVLRHLDPAAVFELAEAERPTSVDLARAFGLVIPERRLLRRAVDLTWPTPALLGGRPWESPLVDGNPGATAAGTSVAQVRSWSRRIIPPFYRPPQSKRKIGDDDLWTFLAIVVSVFVLAFFGLLAALGDSSNSLSFNSSADQPVQRAAGH